MNFKILFISGRENTFYHSQSQFFHDRGNPGVNDDTNFILAEISLSIEDAINNDRMYGTSTTGLHGR